MKTQQTHDETLEWLSRVLHAEFTRAGRSPVSGKEADRPGPEAWFLLVTLRDGRGYLLPSESTALARAGLRLTNPQSVKSSIGRRILDVGLRFGLARHFLAGIDMTASDAPSVLAGLESALGRGRLRVAIALGTPGDVREPLLQLLTPDAKTVGFAKVDWTGRGAVQHEAEILRKLPSFGSVSFLYPEVLFAGALGDRYVCVTSAPGDCDRGAPRRLAREHVKVLRELASWNPATMPLGASSFFETLRGKIDRAATTPQGPQLRAARESVARALGDIPVPFCFSHGDFHPSNMKRSGDRLCLLDWENAQPERPVGFDGFQFLVTNGLLAKHVSPQGIYESWREETTRGPLREYLDEFNVDESCFGGMFLVSVLDRLVYYPLADPANEAHLVPLTALVDILMRHVDG